VYYCYSYATVDELLNEIVRILASCILIYIYPSEEGTDYQQHVWRRKIFRPQRPEIESCCGCYCRFGFPVSSFLITNHASYIEIRLRRCGVLAGYEVYPTTTLCFQSNLY
jgi:hypothetical protein